MVGSGCKEAARPWGLRTAEETVRLGDWDALYRRVRKADERSRALEREERAAREEEAELDAWCDRVTNIVMRAVRDHAMRRARDFEKESGKTIKVKYPSYPSVGDAAGGPTMKFMRFALDGVRLHLYSHRAPGSLPHLHWVIAPRRPGPRSEDESTEARDVVRQQVHTSPSCVIARLPDDVFELRLIRDGGDDGPAATPVTVDDVVYRAFRLLIAAAQRRANG